MKDNVFYKGSGYNWLWNDLADQMIKEGYWSSFYKEHPNEKLIDSNILPAALTKLKTYEGKSLSIRQNLEKDLFQFLEYFSRISEYNQSSYNLLSHHEKVNIFNCLVEYYAQVFTKNQITLFIISRPPHIGQDFVAYRVAEELGIKTLIMFNFPYITAGRFFHVFKNEDFGIFKTSVPSKVKSEFLKIEKGFEKDLSFMNKVNKANESFVKMLLRHPVMTLIFDLWKTKNMFDSYFRYKKNSHYIKSLGRKYLDEIPKSDKINYVYFPLHLQPEMSTSNWGGEYRDQALALEHLSVWLPDGWSILAKENPRQTSFQRDEYFFNRIRNLDKVVLLSKKVDTYKLMKKSKFVATITGTAGWEALTGGKPVVYFGKCVWYSSLPGAYKFSQNLDISMLLDCSIDHSELEDEFNNILGFTHKGVVAYKNNIDDFNKLQNLSNVFEALTEILYEGNKKLLS